MAGQRPELYQRFLEEMKGYVQLADELGYESYCSPEHHLQIEGFEITNHPGMFGLFVGAHAKRLKAGILGYVLPTHNPVRVAEEIATLDHMLQGRLIVGFTRGYHARWVDAYAAVRGVGATNVAHAKAKDEQDAINREIFEESRPDREEGLGRTRRSATRASTGSSRRRAAPPGTRPTPSSARGRTRTASSGRSASPRGPSRTRTRKIYGAVRLQHAHGRHVGPGGRQAGRVRQRPRLLRGPVEPLRRDGRRRPAGTSRARRSARGAGS